MHRSKGHGMIRPKQYAGTNFGGDNSKQPRGQSRSRTVMFAIMLFVGVTYLASAQFSIPTGSLRLASSQSSGSDADNFAFDDHAGDSFGGDEDEGDDDAADDGHEDDNPVGEDDDDNEASHDLAENGDAEDEAHDEQGIPDHASHDDDDDGMSLPSPKKKSEIGISVESFFINFGERVVNIDSTGSYKYVLVKATDREGTSALIVQGCPHSKGTKCKHPDAARVVTRKLTEHGIRGDVLGGGRITRHKLRNSKRAGLISIFGYSKTFSKTGGLCADCNAQACELVKAAYGDYLVRWSNDGYTEKDESKVKDWVICD